jgi:hypothetical protein
MEAMLCGFCKWINFDALRLPYMSEILALRTGQSDSELQFLKRGDSNSIHKRSDLGTLSRVVSSAARCRLCDMIVKLARRRHPTWSSSGMTTSGQQIVCSAESNFYGIFPNSAVESSLYPTYRLSIRYENPEEPNVSGDHFAFQLCETGTTESLSDVPFPNEKARADWMAFGGRKRPLQLDVSWLKNWMNICQRAHGEACGAKGSIRSRLASPQSYIKYTFKHNFST